MAENKFALKAVPEIVFDFSLPPKADALSADEEMALTRTVASYPDLTLGERRQLLGRYRKLAPELRIAICSMAMEKPNLHFFAVQIPQGRGVGGWFNDEGQPTVQLTELRYHRAVHEFDDPYVSYFPKGKRSAYLAWSDLARKRGFGKDNLQMTMLNPLTVANRTGAGITIDASTDVLYLKFHYKEDKKTHFTPFPAYWMLIMDYSALGGIRHIALEFQMPSDKCIYWPTEDKRVPLGRGQGPQQCICGLCGKHQSTHSKVTMAKYWLIVDFLHCLGNLETVYLVFTNVKQGPVDHLHDEHYTASGVADPKGINKPARWEASSGKVFHCEGGSLRELRGNHIILSLAPVVDIVHAYYMFHSHTSIYGTTAPSTRPRAERAQVKFKLAVWASDE